MVYGTTKKQTNFRDTIEAVKESYRKLEPFRRLNKDLIEEWVGNRYSDETKVQHECLVNQLALAVETFTIHMIPQRPAVNITTDHVQHKPTAESLKIAINHEFERMNLQHVLEDIVINAWMRMGIAKIGYSAGNYRRIGNEVVDVGQLFVSSVSLDNWVHDMSCTDFNKCSFYGDRYLITIEEMKKMPLYDKKSHSTKDANSIDAFDNNHDRLKSLSNGDHTYQEADLNDKIEVWDIYLPFEKKIITVPDSQDAYGEKPLKIIEWDGPEAGPYKFLRFGRVPENSMPMGIGPQLMDLHIQNNNLYRKLLDQAKRSKSVVGFKSKHRQDAERVRDADDGEVIAMDDPQAVQEYHIGQINQQIAAHAIMLDQQFDRQAGNMSLMGGLGASSDTVGQEQLLQANGSSRVNLYKSKVRDFVRDVAKDIAWWRYNDANYNPVIFKPIPGTDEKIETSILRIAEFVDFNFEIEPYSIAYNPPEAKLAKVSNVLNQLAPFMQLMMEQGLSIDFESLVNLFADYAAIPEIKDIIKQQPRELDNANPPMELEKPPMNPSTTRRYVRENKPSSNEDGFKKSMIASLMGNNQQDSEQQRMANPLVK